ncbi:unnamed protein product [Rotaria sp. Silwood2]|nr:unnamed protein product [Rotaria sp. Silwood2]
MACSVQPSIHSTSSTTKPSSSEITISRSLTEDFVHISIQPSQDEKLSSCNTCCVVDTSGSMSDAAEIQNDKNENSGNTNLWDDLRTGLEHLSKQQDSIKSISALFLLTHGCPTKIPSDGHLVSLEKLKKNLNFLCAINTFGFGYILDSKLLEDIAMLGNSGSYAFIPDGSSVGTIFVNAISTLLTTAATNLLIHDQDVQNSDYTRWYSTHKTKEGTYIDLGSITYGQNAHLLQVCNNFKDPGVQHYGKGVLFSKIRDEMDDIFCSLPAPISSLTTSAPVDMAVFYNPAGGCFHGECSVSLMNGTTNLVKDVQPGDRMALHGGMV